MELFEATNQRRSQESDNSPKLDHRYIHSLPVVRKEIR